MQHVVRLCAALGWGALCSVSIPAADIALVNHTNVWLYHKGTNAPHPDWTFTEDVELEPTDWASGAGGFGYADNVNETNQCRTILSDMRSRGYTTVYIRKAFDVADVIDGSYHLYLTMDWDDGFIAWLDGGYLTSANWNSAPAEPAYTNRASSSHESSRGGSGAQSAVTYDLGLVGNRLAPGTHFLAIVGLNDSTTSSDFILIADLTTGPFACPPNTICTDTNWTVANSPYVISANLTIASGATLTIEPGVIVQFNPGVNLTVASGGRLLAEGTSNAPIRFTRAGASGNWGNLTINGGAGSPETRIAYAHFEFNGGSPCLQVSAGTVYFDHLTFGNTGVSYLHVDGASFVISDCHFPSATALFESVHGAAGIKSSGRGLFLRNFFGVANSVSGNYNDVVDITGGNRPGPIVQFINNVFIGSGDDHVDLDSTDAWIEGNIFLHAHKNGSPDTASAVSGGADNADTSEITIIGNLIYDCDQAAMAKQGDFFTLLNNTIVHQTHQGGLDTDGAVVALSDVGFTEGAGMYLEGNIIYDAEKLVRYQTASIVTFTNNLMPFAWTGPGGGNSTNDPLLTYIPQLSETVFTNWQQAQVMWDWFSLRPGSPAIGTGPNRRDKGGVIPFGASISGEPGGTTSQTNATLIVGVNCTGSGIPVAGWPNGSGYTHYKWRLDTNAWSAETLIATPITLTGLADGPHHVEVIGKLDSGFYQNDPVFGPTAVVTLSRTWTVNTAAELRILGCHRADDSVTLSFEAVAGQSYSALYSDSLHPAHWIKFHDLAPPPMTGVQVVTDTNATTAVRFYRIVTPAQP